MQRPSRMSDTHEGDNASWGMAIADRGTLEHGSHLFYVRPLLAPLPELRARQRRSAMDGEIFLPARGWDRIGGSWQPERPPIRCFSRACKELGETTACRCASRDSAIASARSHDVMRERCKRRDVLIREVKASALGAQFLNESTSSRHIHGDLPGWGIPLLDGTCGAEPPAAWRAWLLALRSFI